MTLKIYEEHRHQIERDLQPNLYAPGLYLLSIGTSSGHPGIRYEFLPLIDRQTMIQELACFYGLSGATPACRDLLPYEWWNDNCTARVERWLVTLENGGSITEHALYVVEHIDAGRVEVCDPELRDQMAQYR
ncbi:hypothetical protein [Fluviibacter phosphoraccumulans]|uniref:hypothetical protein n=1 Tax=Fluviibacter phosphoraccumulans TaxID=1751046 RepID=UPI001B3C6DFB|nr:hypothetical protein [Fluviibacter phosphoraccumulans]